MSVKVTYFLFFALLFPLVFLHNLQGASAIVSHHNRNLVQTLMDLFPNIGLEKSKFDIKCMFLIFPYKSHQIHDL